ncbi:hypothetical protein [Staphylococcus debuckii]|uniref:Phosphohexomutase n=1 Tax=Staphylococcus debuckii TaxID=2044912 RepID=A0ABU9EUP8_9STAP
MVSVIKGAGSVNIDGEKTDVEKGKHFIITANDQNIDFQGDMSIIVSYV